MNQGDVIRAKEKVVGRRERLLKFFKFSEEIRLGKMADNRALRNGNGMEGRE